jgi:hypothetical protein
VPEVQAAVRARSEAKDGLRHGSDRAMRGQRIRRDRAAWPPSSIRTRRWSAACAR